MRECNLVFYSLFTLITFMMNKSILNPDIDFRENYEIMKLRNVSKR